MGGLFVRVTERGTKTFVLYTRYPGSKGPTRRALGEYGALTLAEARDKARSWKRLIKRGIDPTVIEEQERQAELRKRENTFAAAAEKFIGYIHRQKLRTAAQMERDLRNAFIARWAKRPITEITSDDIKRVIREALGASRKLYGVQAIRADPTVF